MNWFWYVLIAIGALYGLSMATLLLIIWAGGHLQDRKKNEEG